MGEGATRIKQRIQTENQCLTQTMTLLSTVSNENYLKTICSISAQRLHVRYTYVSSLCWHLSRQGNFFAWSLKDCSVQSDSLPASPRIDLRRKSAWPSSFHSWISSSGTMSRMSSKTSRFILAAFHGFVAAYSLRERSSRSHGLMRENLSLSAMGGHYHASWRSEKRQLLLFHELHHDARRRYPPGCSHQTATTCGLFHTFKE